MSEKIVQTAGRDQLGEFAPMFAHLNDDVLFGEVWNEEAIDVKTKCIITVVHHGFVAHIPPAECKGTWRDKGRDRCDHHTRNDVRRLAERLGSVPPCKGSMGLKGDRQ